MSYKLSTLNHFSAFLTPSSVSVTALVFSSYIKSASFLSDLVKASASLYKDTLFNSPPEIINGVLASSINTESASSIIT